jgi:hypothetical protein
LSKRRNIWSIGIYGGDDPTTVYPLDKIINPVMTFHDVTDIQASYVADPFMIYEGRSWYMFFEVMNTVSKKGEIGLATSSDGFNWQYRRSVLREPFHISYPFVFQWDGEYYMTPESARAMAIRLYKAEDFPNRWVYVKDLLQGQPYNDPTIEYINGKYWLFAGLGIDILLLHYAESPLGPWYAHAKNPVISGKPSVARPGGRIICAADRTFRYAQNCEKEYGGSVSVLEVLVMTPTAYVERELDNNPVLHPGGAGWNAEGMHTIDLHRVTDSAWIACVDGRRTAGPITSLNRLLRRWLHS